MGFSKGKICGGDAVDRVRVCECVFVGDTSAMH